MWLVKWVAEPVSDSDPLSYYIAYKIGPLQTTIARNASSTFFRTSPKA
jgi:hypothetical protein